MLGSKYLTSFSKTDRSVSMDMGLSLQMLQIPSDCNSLSVIARHMDFRFSLLIVTDFYCCVTVVVSSSFQQLHTDCCITSSNKP